MSKAKQAELLAAEAEMQLAKERREFVDMAAVLTMAQLMTATTTETADYRGSAAMAFAAAEALWRERQWRNAAGVQAQEPPVIADEVVEGE
jgi:hypothetical protein